MLTYDRIFFTKEGLSGVEDVIESRSKNAYRNKKIPHPDVDVSALRETRRDAFEINIIKPIREEQHDDSDRPLKQFTPSLG